MIRIHLSNKKIMQPARIFIPSSSELDYIDFLNRLPAQSYRYIPDDYLLILDFEILKEYSTNFLYELDDVRIVYENIEYTFNEFINLFPDEKNFFLLPY